jgi:ribose-phosphate pyrophosphokinase
VTPLVLALPGNELLADTLARKGQSRFSRLETRRFPDGETYLRVDADYAGRSVALVCTLDRPDDKLLPLLFLADTLRDLGAARVGLVAPYLAYMRQDRRFQPGEAVTSRIFGALLSTHFDWLVTVDPHLHRFRSLAELYTIPTRVVHAAPALATWIAANVARPFLIGPDQESEQWVADVAKRVGAPCAVLTKVRRGDRDVEVSVPDLEQHRDRTPVVLDDIVSSARTMIQTTRHVVEAGLAAPVCLGVHGIFSGDAQRRLEAAGAGRIVTTRTVTHSSNAIEIVDLLVGPFLALASGDR